MGRQLPGDLGHRGASRQCQWSGFQSPPVSTPSSAASGLSPESARAFSMRRKSFTSRAKNTGWFTSTKSCVDVAARLRLVRRAAIRLGAKHLDRQAATIGNIVGLRLAGGIREADDGLIRFLGGKESLGKLRGEIGKDLQTSQRAAMRLNVYVSANSPLLWPLVLRGDHRGEDALNILSFIRGDDLAVR